MDLEVTYSNSGMTASASPSGISAGGSPQAEHAQQPDGTSSISAAADEPLTLLISLSVTDVLCGSSSGSGGGQPPTPMSFATTASAGGSSATCLARGSSLAGPQGVRPGSAAAAGAALHGVNLQQQELVDPGAFVVGCYSGLKVRVQPGGKEVVRLQVLLVQPGLYQFGVADVVCLSSGAVDFAAAGGGGAPAAAFVAVAAAAGARGGSDSSSKAGSRVYFNQDRLYVHVS